MTSIPAAIISRSEAGAAALGGRIEVGGKADFILFKAQSLHEIMCRPTTPRWVVRNGAVVTTPLPSYSELSDVNTTSGGVLSSTTATALSSLPEVMLESTLQKVKMDTVDTVIPIIDIAALAQYARPGGSSRVPADAFAHEKVLTL